MKLRIIRLANYSIKSLYNLILTSIVVKNNKVGSSYGKAMKILSKVIIST